MPADGADVFRTFVIPIPVAAARYVRAIEFHPGNAARRASRQSRRRSHALVASARRARSRARLRRQHGARCALSRRAAARVDAGTGARMPCPDGTQWRLEPGSDLVVQLHLQPTGKPERVGVTVGFFFTADAPTRDARRPAPGQRDDRHSGGRAGVRRRRSVSAAGRRRGAGRAAARAQPRAADGGQGGAARRHDALADRDRRLGFPLAGRLSLRGADRACRRAPRCRSATPTTTPPAIPATLISRPRASSGARTRRTRWAISGCS